MEKKVIGVCLTKVSDRTRAEYARHLTLFAAKKGFKLIVYNSVLDFYHNDSFDEGAAQVYSYIDYDMLDGLILMPRHIYNKTIVENIISSAKAHDIPVITVGEEYEGCYALIEDYTTAYKSVISHVIREHGARDTYFIAGLRENDPDSVLRIQCYKEVLEENGIEFSDSLVGYGEYWRNPTIKVMNELLLRPKLPQAIFCANDFMALAAIEALTANGKKVPEDVIVTGFDGVPDADFFSPRITTCCEDLSALAESAIDCMEYALEGGEPCVRKYDYKPKISESCGCYIGSEEHSRDVSALFYRLQEIETHERMMMSCLDRMCDEVSFQKFSGILTEVLGHAMHHNNSWIGLNSKFTECISGINDVAEDEVYVIASAKCNAMPRKISKKALIPRFDEWLNDETVYIFTSVYIGNRPCGVYAVRSVDITDCTNKLNLTTRVINIGLSSYSNLVSRLSMKRSMDSALIHNQITKLPNLRGLNNWFEQFSSDPENHSMALTVSLYAIPNYRYILENYGVKDVEESQCVVAKFLSKANPENCIVAQTADDEYIVINYYTDPNDISDTINRATSVFFGLQEENNRTNGKDYYIEVNCGCAVVNPGWQETLETYMKVAASEMYANRLNAGMGSAVKKQSAPMDYYHAFNALIEKNLFSYHFQPIVSAKTGEIIAYEALMRTDASIGMNPLQVLDAAKAYNRLYDIERATIFNVMERYDRDNAQFHGRNLFINSIPGYFLDEADSRSVRERYEKYLNSFVFEITEQDTVTETELDKIKQFGPGIGNQIAIDDYGTGHSNIVNLLRYTPNIIKIDRFLITEIQNDQNKQMFVKSTIEFARMNNIKVLAEGVETAEELITVIGFGVDYIQGFYTGRPQYEPIDRIAESVLAEIISANG